MENYKERYKEALERAQKMQENSNGMILKKWLWGVFPELKEKESEDERIRNGLINGFKECLKDCQYPKDAVKYWHNVEVHRILAWLDKQGEKKEKKPIFKADDWYVSKVDGKIHNAKFIEKQGGEKPTDKVELKFKPGDWIIFNGLILHIDEVVNGYYRTTSKGDGIHNSYDWNIDNAARLWTIQEAKDGDVLVDEDNNIGLYREEKDDLYWHSYIYIGCDNCLRGFGGYHNYENTKPATKEQRELLFQKMKEAGYKWDSEKKELKKMEVVSKESEDERIRKAIIRILKGETRYTSKEDADKYVTWLEKQGLEKQGELLNESVYDTKDKEIYQAISIGLTDVFNEFGWSDFGGIPIEDIQNWLEKQGEQESTLPKWKYKKDNTPLLRDSLILNKYGCVAKSLSGAIVSDVWVLDYDELAKLPKEELEKQEEKKPTDEVNPKFKVRDWILNDVCFPLQIASIRDGMYVFTEGDAISVSFVDEHLHLWTIQDAMDGDVLATDNFIFIFKSIDNSNGVHYYCHYEISKREDDRSRFGIALPQSLMGIVGSSFTHYKPATKEQHDLLFQKMKEEGYVWDANNKELKKIEQKPADKTEPKFKVRDWCIDKEDGTIFRIEKVMENTYDYKTDKGNVYSCTHDSLEFDSKLWTIADAKDGDVLINWNNTIFIFNAIEDETVKFHIAYNEKWDTIKTPSTKLSHLGLPEPQFEFHPATKEQHDLLFQKMKEAGYEWNNDKKELKKI